LRLPSGTVTFLFTDIEGSTRLLHELGAEGYAEALAEHADNHVDGESPLGRIEICGGIALDDFAVHPDRFPYDPAGNLDGAARLVYEAIQEPLRADERAKNRLSKRSEK